jgi:hypothetical protein
MNLLDFLAGKSGLQVICLTSRNNRFNKYITQNIYIRRFGFDWSQSMPSKFRRLFTYLSFNIGSLLYLIRFRPKKVLYYETLSSWPVYAYHFFFRNAKIYIHYHEYSSPVQYQTGMKLEKYLHVLEKKLYPNVDWISHTNKFRLHKFKEDQNLTDFEGNQFEVMPNYPPQRWGKIEKGKKAAEGTTKLVCVGHTLSFDTMYCKELLDWVSNNSKKVKLDCYLHKKPEAIKSYLYRNKISNVNLYDAVMYNDLPKVLIKYDLGLIIYKAHIENFKYNAPNKLFEYLACGLDVWFPEVMTGSMEYVCEEAEPRVLALDFERLEQYSISYLFGRADLPRRETNHICEPVYEKLYQAMLGNKAHGS